MDHSQVSRRKQAIKRIVYAIENMLSNVKMLISRSIQYSPDCEFPRRAGVEIYVIVGVVAVVLLVAVAAFTWSRFRRRRDLTQVPTEDSA